MIAKSLLLKIFLLIFIAILVPLLIFSIFNYNITRDKLTENLIDAAQDDSEKASYHFMVELGEYFNILHMMSSSQSIQSGFKGYYDGSTTSNDLYSIISREVSGSQYFKRVNYPFDYIFIAEDSLILTRYNHSGRISYNKTQLLLKNSQWLSQIEKNTGGIPTVFQSPDFVNVHGGDKIYIGKNIMLDDDRSVVLLVGTDRVSLDRLIDNYLPSDDSSIFVYREDELISFGTENILDELSLSELNSMKNLDNKVSFIRNEKTFYFSDTPKTPWNLLIFTPTRSITETIVYIKNITYVLMVFCVLSALVLFAAAKKHIFDRIVILNRAMQKVEQGDLNVYLEPNLDEIGTLYQGFNSMTRAIEVNQRKALAEEKERAAIELVMLQSQITPHFMRNTLNVIRWMAEMIKAEGIARAIVSLTRLLDYNIRKSSQVVTIGDEITNIQEYMYIQQLRYGNKFTCNIFVDDEILGQPSLKLLLQPIVENCIIHGFSDIREVGIINIHGKRHGNDVRLIVEDNGSGVDPVQIDTMLIDDSIKATNRIGIYNVHKRIKSRYGNKYGLVIYPNHPSGLCVEITLPFEEDGYESNDS